MRRSRWVIEKIASIAEADGDHHIMCGKPDEQQRIFKFKNTWHIGYKSRVRNFYCIIYRFSIINIKIPSKMAVNSSKSYLYSLCFSLSLFLFNGFFSTLVFVLVLNNIPVREPVARGECFEEIRSFFVHPKALLRKKNL